MGHFERFEDADIKQDQVLPIPPVPVAIVWDIGPQLPVAVPTRPDSTAPPSAWQDYETDVSRHIALVLKYRRARAEWVQKHGGGPVRLELDPLSAREAIERGGGRWVSSLPHGLGKT